MGELPPALVLVAGALAVAAVPRRWQGPVMVAAPVLALAQVLTIDLETTRTLTFFGYEAEVVRVDRLSRAFGIVFALAGVLGAVYGLRLMRTGECVAALLYVGSAMGVVFAGDLLTLFVFWEVKALASTAVVWAGPTAGAARAARRYLYVHLTGGTLLLAGILQHVSATGDLAFAAFDLSEPGAWLILVAFAVNASVVPLHAWLPDAYPRASVAGTVFLSAFTTKAAIYALARGFPGTELLVWAGLLMAVYGTIYALLENDIRRLLCYSIVSQLGYMVAAVGLGTPEALNGATAHAFAHILYKALLLMGAGAVLYATGRDKLTELGGLARQMPVVLGLYVIGALSIAGVPLFSGFVTKELTLDAAEMLHRTVVVDVLKLASIGTLLHTGLRLPYFTWFGGPSRVRAGPVPPTLLVGMGLAAAVNIAIGLAPTWLYELLPAPVDYEPYTMSHVLPSLQMLVFAGLAFWLLAHWLSGRETTTLDADWVYRSLPAHVAAAGRATAGRIPLEPAGLTLAQPVRAAWRRARVASGQEDGQHTRVAVAPTWWLGAVALTASLGLLALGFLF